MAISLLWGWHDDLLDTTINLEKRRAVTSVTDSLFIKLMAHRRFLPLRYRLSGRRTFAAAASMHATKNPMAM
jgi:hypothetical protein